MFTTYQEAAAAWQADRPRLEALGVSFEAGAEPKAYIPDPFRRDYGLAMDAQPVLQTDPNSAVPALFTTMVDPTSFEILFARLAAAKIIGEQRRGTWVDDTIMFPTIEHVGDVSSYGDYANSGMADANVNWPQRQSYLFQTFVELGDREIERMGLARIQLVAEKNKAAATILNRGQNTIYHFGVAGLQNYGMVNDPSLSAALTPSTKTAGGVTWFTAGGAPNAQANEVYNDIVALYQGLVDQTDGLVAADTRMVLVLPTSAQGAMQFTNTFNVNVLTLLKGNFPNLRIEPDALYNATSSVNPLGIAAGNLVQLIAEEIEGQQTAFCAFNEKMRSHRVVMESSAYKQKRTSGAWGAVIRMSMGFSQMVGV